MRVSRGRARRAVLGYAALVGLTLATASIVVPAAAFAAAPTVSASASPMTSSLRSEPAGTIATGGVARIPCLVIARARESLAMLSRSTRRKFRGALNLATRLVLMLVLASLVVRMPALRCMLVSALIRRLMPVLVPVLMRRLMRVVMPVIVTCAVGALHRKSTSLGARHLGVPATTPTSPAPAAKLARSRVVNCRGDGLHPLRIVARERSTVSFSRTGRFRVSRELLARGRRMRTHVGWKPSLRWTFESILMTPIVASSVSAPALVPSAGSAVGLLVSVSVRVQISHFEKVRWNGIGEKE
jgi:hypothetical protein